MSKRINKSKLKAMGMAKVQSVCIRHATRALEYKERGEHRKMKLHCDLLDQCAAVGRALNGKRVKIEVDAASLICDSALKCKRTP